MPSSLGFHHAHVRVRMYAHHQPYPHPDPRLRLLDRLIIVVGLSGPIMTLPQIWQIFATGSADGVSLLTWAWYAGGSAFWILYASVHHERPLLITHIAWLVVNGAVVVGIVLHG